MQFKRYNIIIKDAITWLSFAPIILALLGGIMYALACMVIIIATTWFGVAGIAHDEGGSLNDYVIITDDQVELHCKGKGKNKTIVIQWDDVVAYKRITSVLGGNFKSIIVDKYGTKISYATSYKRDKKIFAIRPELKDLIVDSPEWEK